MAKHEAHNQPKKRVRGVVDRIVGGIVVVVIKHPTEIDHFVEIHVPIEQFKKAELREGDKVTVLIDQ